MIICGFLVYVVVSVIGYVKSSNILILKIVHVKNVYLVNFEDVILNTTETSFVDKKVAYGKK